MKDLLLFVIHILFIGNSIQAQIYTKVNLTFLDKVSALMTENHVPAVGIGIIEDG